MSIKAYVNLDNSPFLKARFEKGKKEYEDLLLRLNKEIERGNGEEKFNRFFTFNRRLKHAKEFDAMKATDPYYMFLCSRNDAIEAYDDYKDKSVVIAYIMSKIGCSFGEAKKHIPSLITELRKERISTQSKIYATKYKRIKNDN